MKLFSAREGTSLIRLFLNDISGGKWICTPVQESSEEDYTAKTRSSWTNSYMTWCLKWVLKDKQNSPDEKKYPHKKSNKKYAYMKNHNLA